MTIQSTQQRTEIVLNLGELRAAQGGDTALVCLGLGSCVGLCAYDPVARVGGMAHMVLPTSSEDRGGSRSPKFVDCAIPMLIEEMEQLGALRSLMIIKIVGGAQMVSMGAAAGVLHIGERNVEAAKAAVAGLGLQLRGADTGGTHGRTVRLYLNSGQLLVSIAGGVSHEL